MQNKNLARLFTSNFRNKSRNEGKRTKESAKFGKMCLEFRINPTNHDASKISTNKSFASSPSITGRIRSKGYS